LFEKKEYIMDSTFGVCMVEKVTKLVVGREQQMEYYVLQSAADKKKKAYIPVQNHETVLRKLMTPEQAMSVLEKIKMTINGNDALEVDTITVEEAQKILEGGEPDSWGKASSYLLKRKEEISPSVAEILEKIWGQLVNELAFVLKKSKDDIRQMVNNRIK
jgi:RNA polymerase-interacting CarD/CdnL/TRCF family regulator